ncbi:MAG: hypothetical protein AAF726_22765 [Planctomycetota bacterium]
MKTHTARIGVLLGVLSPVAAAQQDPALFRKSSVPYAQFAHDVAPYGDYDGDGHDDLLVGTPASYASFPGQGQVQIISGVDGRALLTTTDFDDRWSLGSSVAAVDDVDGDGVTDFAIGSLKRSFVPGIRSRVSVHSGATGARLWLFEEQTEGESLGDRMDAVGDQDGDGIRDLLVGGPGSSSVFQSAGVVMVLSGADGAVIRRIDGFAEAESFGASVSRLGDVDGDGIEDFMAGAPGAFGPPNFAMLPVGKLRIFSGASGAVLRTITGRDFRDPIGGGCDEIGDVDGDGVPDLLVNAGSTAAFVSTGPIVVFSAATGTPLLTIRQPFNSGVALSRQASGVGDANGDGRPDIAYSFRRNSFIVVRVIDALTGDLHMESIDLGPFVNAYIPKVTRAGDLDGDGRPDIACAVPDFSRHAHQAGALLTFTGVE